jgi:hypothetical protein
LAKERELKLIRGNTPGEVAVDVCFCLDVTGSMSMWLDTAKHQMTAIARDIPAKVKGQFGEHLQLKLRFGVVAFRDFGDVQQTQELHFTEVVGELQNFVSYLSCLVRWFII